MANELATPSAAEAARSELKSYNVTIPMGSLAIGVDNIHHDVFLSPRFVQATRDYLFDLIRQATSSWWGMWKALSPTTCSVICPPAMRTAWVSVIVPASPVGGFP